MYKHQFVLIGLFFWFIVKEINSHEDFMPELPEVETIKEALKRSIDKADILSIKIRNRNFRETIPSDFEEKIRNATICQIYRKAKYIVFELSNKFSIILHLGMSGKIKILDTFPEDLEKHDHIIFTTTKGILIYNDARRFGLLTYIESHKLENHHLFKNIGIDPFDKNLDAQYLFNILSCKKIPIKIALLDQSIISGIGNIYAFESLYEAGISPMRFCSDIRIDEIKKLIIAIRYTLEKAIAAGGSTLRDYRKPDGSMGYFQNQHCVYGKAGQRCPNCSCDLNKSGGILKITQGGRSTFYCEHLQK